MRPLISFLLFCFYLSFLPPYLPSVRPSFPPLLFVRQGVREGKGFEPNRVVASFKGTVLRGGERVEVGRGWHVVRGMGANKAGLQTSSCK